jgi:formylglycine-generating enzyme required for sulfatase activity
MNRDSRRVARGGSWLSHAQGARATYRRANDPSHRFCYLGLRFCRRCV